MDVESPGKSRRDSAAVAGEPVTVPVKLLIKTKNSLLRFVRQTIARLRLPDERDSLVILLLKINELHKFNCYINYWTNMPGLEKLINASVKNYQ